MADEVEGCTTTWAEGVEVLGKAVASEGMETTEGSATGTTGGVARLMLAQGRTSPTGTLQRSRRNSSRHTAPSRTSLVRSVAETKATRTATPAEGDTTLGLFTKILRFLLPSHPVRKTRIDGLSQISRLLDSRFRTSLGVGGLCRKRLPRRTSMKSMTSPRLLSLLKLQLPSKSPSSIPMLVLKVQQIRQTRLSPQLSSRSPLHPTRLQ